MAYIVQQPRRERRATFTVESRVALAEDDLDYQEGKHSRDITAIRDDVNTVKGRLLAVLLSTTTAALLLAADILSRALSE